jgi:adenylate kinase family enzyme
MKRVMIAGGPGSGKSTLAWQLGAITGLPVFHMDHIHWKPNWVERDGAEKDSLTKAVHAKDSWIFEGGHKRTYDERVARADTFIWLDFPLSQRVWRVLWRAFKYRGQSRPDLPENCPEQFNAETLRLLAFIWRTRNSSSEKLVAISGNPPSHLTIYKLQNLREVHSFSNSLNNDASQR